MGSDASCSFFIISFFLLRVLNARTAFFCFCLSFFFSLYTPDEVVIGKEGKNHLSLSAFHLEGIMVLTVSWSSFEISWSLCSFPFLSSFFYFKVRLRRNCAIKNYSLRFINTLMGPERNKAFENEKWWSFLFLFAFVVSLYHPNVIFSAFMTRPPPPLHPIQLFPHQGFFFFLV